MWFSLYGYDPSLVDRPTVGQGWPTREKGHEVHTLPCLPSHINECLYGSLPVLRTPKPGLSGVVSSQSITHSTHPSRGLRPILPKRSVSVICLRNRSAVVACLDTGTRFRCVANVRNAANGSDPITTQAQSAYDPRAPQERSERDPRRTAQGHSTHRDRS